MSVASRTPVFIGSYIMLVLMLASCDPIVNTRGHRWEETDFRQIIEGQSTRDDVRAVLGSPSAEADFNGNIWYYITARKEAVAFLAPEVTSQQVAAVEFSADGFVERVTTYDTEDRNAVVVVGKTTPTEGKTFGFMEQFVGNIGRFNAPGGRAPGQATRPRR
jgi:outer membrane protein assembly factor BamE (lipoprotein component of BamABCDE complex)